MENQALKYCEELIRLFDSGDKNIKAKLLLLKYKIKESIPIEPPVKPATCGYCKDCKFWNTENAECTNDVIFINKEIAIGYISDFKTQNFFGCIKFESKLSV